MAPSKLKKAIGAVKDQTSIGIAKVSNINSISDLDVAIVKTTSHNEYPAEERHIREILSLTCYSRNFVSQCVSTLSRRLGKTRSWTVALKTLILIHRLLCEGDPAYEQEIFFATRRGTRMLNLSDFRDTSRSDSWDYSAFVRTYARYLDEMLEYRMHGRRTRRRSRSQVMHEDWNEEQQMPEDVRASPSSVYSGVVEAKSTPVREMKIESIFTRTQHLQQLLELFLACRPTGSAKHHRIVAMALYPILKESSQLYFDLQEIIGIFVDRFMELELPDCTRVFEIFTRLSKQFDELDKFYSWCKSSGISRASEFPEITKINQQKLDAMDDLIREKSNLSHKKVKSFEQLTSEEDAEYESSRIKSLPAPEPPQEEKEEEEQPKEEEKPEEEPKQEENNLAIVNVDEPVDFLNLRDDTVTLEDHADKFALTLFDGSEGADKVPAWEAFKESESDWETALVESASNISGQRASMGGGFDMLLLDGMYGQQRQPSSSASGYGEGSASSVVLPKSQSAPMLALPAPGAGMGMDGGDPFAASLSVPAPSYVQMTDLEKKQRLMVEEQVMWQNYAKGGMQGEVTMAKWRSGGGFAQRF